ncbi:MAG: FtsX-like permease family protein [Acidobacteriota bacterium]|nr:FtsX-like permease family protein [Acidobacteriota bacterium]
MKGTSLTVFAWRNLWRNRRRTLLTLASISFGVFLAVLMTAMQDRNWADMIDLAAKIGAGHVTVQHPDYLETPTLTRTVTGLEGIAASASSIPTVVRAVPRISGPTMLATAQDSFGAAFIAVDPAQETPETLSVLEAIVDGEMFSSADDKGIILGARLASNLGAEIGDRVVYTMTDKEGEMISGVARLRALVRTGAPTLDGGLSLLPIGALRGVLGYNVDEATQLAVFIDDQRRSDMVAAELQATLDDDAAAVPWHRQQPELSAFIAMKVGGSVFIEAVLAILIAAGIFNTLFVSVMERLREFGILMALGFTPSRLFRLVMLESFWLGGVGLVAAALITAGPYYYLSSQGLDAAALIGEGMEIAGVGMPPVMKVGLFAKSAVLITLGAMAATLLAGLYPAWRAGHVEPAESIKAA